MDMMRPGEKQVRLNKVGFLIFVEFLSVCHWYRDRGVLGSVRMEDVRNC